MIAAETQPPTDRIPIRRGYCVRFRMNCPPAEGSGLLPFHTKSAVQDEISSSHGNRFQSGSQALLSLAMSELYSTRSIR